MLFNVVDLMVAIGPSNFHNYSGTLIIALIAVPVTAAVLIRNRLWWLHIVLIVECVYILSRLDVVWMGIDFSTAAIAVALLLSLLSDFLALVTVRKVFSFISNSLSIVRIVAAVGGLTAVTILFMLIPSIGV